MLFGSSDLSTDGDASNEWKPTNVPVLQPLHQALKVKKQHDEALAKYLKTNPNANKADLESFKQNFLADMSRSMTPVPNTVVDDPSKSKAQEQPKVLPVKNLNSYFDPENATNSNVRPSMLMSGKSLTVPVSHGIDNPLPLPSTTTPQSFRPVNISLNTPPAIVPLSSKTPDMDLVSVASSGLSAPPSSAASPSINHDAVAAAFLSLRPPSTSTVATPSSSSIWPFNSATTDTPSQHPNILPPTDNINQPVQSFTPPTAYMPSPQPVPAPAVETPGISLWPFTSAGVRDTNINPQSAVNPLNGEKIPSGTSTASEVGNNASMSSLWPFPSFPPEGMMTTMNPLPTPMTADKAVDYKELLDQLVKEKVSR